MDIIHYKKAYEVTMYVNCLNNTFDKIGWDCPIGRSSFGRTAVITRTSDSEPYYAIRYACCYSRPAPGDKVFLSSESKIPRDLVRNTGYQIVRDKNTASFVIMPEPEKPEPYKAFLFYKTYDNDFYIISLYDTSGGAITEVNSDLATECELGMRAKYGDGQMYKYQVQHKCYFYRNVPEHLEILGGVHPWNCMFDTELILTPSTDITPENLAMLAKLPSKEQALKLIMSSDFKKYPLTMCLFLKNDLSISYGYKYGDQVNWMMKCIEYNEFEEKDSFKKPVTPEDFKMLQDWILYKLNIKDSGIVSTELVDELDSGYNDFLLSKTAVKRVDISQPISLDSIRTMIQNSK